MTERRGRPRKDLRIPLFLCSVPTCVVTETVTENISMGGFFCRSEQFFAPHQRIRFLLVVSHDPLTPMYLDGVVEVTHVAIGASRFGLGCQVCSYRVLTDPALRVPESVKEILMETSTAEIQQLPETFFFSS